MIGDLSNAPEPIQIKIFSDDEALLTQLGPRVGDAIGKIPGVVDVQNGIENTISGPATNFHVNPTSPRGSASRRPKSPKMRRPFSTDCPTNDPLIANGRPYTIRVRLDDDHRKSLDAIENTVFNSSSGHTATLRLARHHRAASAAERDSPRESAAHGRRHGPS